MAQSDTLHCDTCDSAIAVDDARRSETYGDLDPHRWQTLCCPTCGSRLKTVFVGDQ